VAQLTGVLEKGGWQMTPATLLSDQDAKQMKGPK
jgi:hypothetical protein